MNYQRLAKLFLAALLSTCVFAAVAAPPDLERVRALIEEEKRRRTPVERLARCSGLT